MSLVEEEKNPALPSLPPPIPTAPTYNVIYQVSGGPDDEEADIWCEESEPGQCGDFGDALTWRMGYSRCHPSLNHLSMFSYQAPQPGILCPTCQPPEPGANYLPPQTLGELPLPLPQLLPSKLIFLLCPFPMSLLQENTLTPSFFPPQRLGFTVPSL